MNVNINIYFEPSGPFGGQATGTKVDGRYPSDQVIYGSISVPDKFRDRLGNIHDLAIPDEVVQTILAIPGAKFSRFSQANGTFTVPIPDNGEEMFPHEIMRELIALARGREVVKCPHCGGAFDIGKRCSYCHGSGYEFGCNPGVVHNIIPKKVLLALTENHIQGVVRGYTTRLAEGVGFTGWDKFGKVVCVLVKKPHDTKWRIQGHEK